MMKLAVLAITLAALVKGAWSCGGVLSGNSGEFTSPNHPNNYPKNRECTWTLDASQQTYTLSFPAFDIEDQDTCNYDYLEVKQGNTVVGKLCGSSTPPPMSLSGAITITFKSDSSVQRTGFMAAYSAGSVVPTGATGATPAISTAAPSGCGGDFNGQTGTVQSPNHPNNYDNNLDCTYTITIPEGNVLLKFEAFAVESSGTCSYDYLEVLEDGVSRAKLCGSAASNYKASSNAVTLRFKTDSSVQMTGWKISFERSTCGSGNECASSCNGTSTGDYCESVGNVCCQPDLSAEGCGVRNVPKNRIVGGDHAARHTWPWQASLQSTSSSFHFCGATLINNFWAMTAAHCVDGSSASSMKVVLGEHHVTESGQEDADPVTMTIAKVIMHENYDGNGNGFPNDIALLKFTQAAPFTDQIVPACLPASDMEIAGSSDCWITGWGNTQDASHPSEILNELKVDVLTQSVCSDKWGSSYINDGHVCLNNGLSGACNGDSGGPLSCKGADGKWYVNGATSWGRSGCQTEGYPSVYSRVTFFLNWINAKLHSE